MMNLIQTPITQENFKDNWEYVDQKLRDIAKRKVVRKAVALVGNIVHFFYLAVVGFGILYNYENASFQAYLDGTPILADAWKWLSSILSNSEIHWVVQLLIYILPGYVVVAAICGIVYVLIWFLYKPNSRHAMTDNIAEDAAELYKMTKFAKIRTSHFSPATSFACNALFIFGTLLYLTGYVVHLIEVQDGTAMAELLTSSYFGNPLLSTMIGLGFMSAYTILNSGMGYMLMPMYMTKFPEEMVTAAENFYHECNPEIKARFEEEEKVLAQAKEINNRRREEKKAFEEELRWKNPIWKKVKVGCIIAMVIAMVFLFGWVASKVDMNAILETLDSYRGNEEVMDTEVADTEDSTEIVEE